jgi:hypothetical protein
VPYADQVALVGLVERAQEKAAADARAAAEAEERKPRSPDRLRLIRRFPPTSLAAWRSRPHS